MKNSLLAIALAAATLPLTFAQTTPAPTTQTPSQDKTATKKNKKVKKSKKSKKDTGTTGSTASPSK